MKVTIDIPAGKKAEWVDGVLTLVDDDPRDITERVKTFEDAVRELGDDHEDVVLFRRLNDRLLPTDVRAYLKLRIIAAALNEGWKPTFEEQEERWFPYFNIADGGKVHKAWECGGDSTYTAVNPCSCLVFETRERALYAGQQFTDIWADFLTKQGGHE